MEGGGVAVSMGLLLIGLEMEEAQGTVSDKYLAPVCLKYLSVALDTMSANASSVPVCFLYPRAFFFPCFFFFCPDVITEAAVF